MKNLIFVLFLVFGLTFSFTFAQFSDSEQSPYASAITQLANRNIVKGYPDGTFKPQQAITRAELLKIILLAANVELSAGQESCFSDVPKEERYVDIVCSAKAMGIVKWYDDWTFKPNQTVTFVEGLKMAIEGFKVQTRDVKSDFWYARYLDFVHQNWIFSQYAYYPEQKLTREMMAHLAIKLLEGLSGSWNYTRNVESLGCGKSQPSTPPSAVMVNGVERHFITSVGRNYSSSKPAKLVFAFHGRTSDNASLGYYGIEGASDGNVITVYPAGLPEEGPQRNRRDPWDKVSNLRDYQLFDEIKKLISEQYCIDPGEVYVVGHSLGGWFTSMLGCARAEAVRWVGIVAGSPMRFPTCLAPTPAIIFHNPSDNLASFAWGEQIRNQYLKQNQCWADTIVYENSYGMECVKYTSCLPTSPVVFCKYSEGNHMWPSWAEQLMRKFWSEQ